MGTSSCGLTLQIQRIMALSFLRSLCKSGAVWAHARIQEFSSGGGGGVQVSLTKKALTTFFCFFLVLSLFYRSQMVNFKEIYHFSRFQRGSNIFQGGGGGSNFFQGGGGDPIAYSL